jgi:protein-disulfide reductase (glutathione)
MLESRVNAALRCVLGLGLLGPACGNADPAARPGPAGTAAASAPSRGWGDQIAWRTLDDALAEAKTRHAPLMLVVHTSWCHKCRALKDSFQSPQLRQLSERLVMVNLDQDAEPAALDYAPDGNYVPRIVFLDPDGKVDRSLANPRPSRFRYFYRPQDDLLAIMRSAVERHGESS